MRKNIKIFLIAAVLFAGFASLSFADSLENKNAVGFYLMGGPTCGGSMGLQYERRITPLFGLKFDTYVMYHNNNNTNYQSNNLIYNFNVEGDIKIYETMWDEYIGTRLFAYFLAGHIGYVTSAYEEKRSDSTIVYHPSNYYANVMLGAGFGIDLILVEHLSIPVTLGFLAEFPYDFKAGFCGGIAVRYSW